ncbi:ABC transporter permease [Halobacillus naozhouensis]|uniref:ABC transporter permease subunit n=1 Tax=Halobacillus naozhouensis TaxID=554880 RepID=A0ABY8J0S6_9BACI|nr:ABC transporter permease subunit [Halobacillus naozhouensis]WFT74496.1 ABC transporter permease subunit [Halobacillus naozhouensis]
MRRMGHRFHVAVTVLLLITIGIPFLPLILSSFSHGWQWPEVIPHTFSLRAWVYVFSVSSGTWDAIWTSLVIAFIVTFINLLLALPAANVLGRMTFRGKWLIEGLIYAPIIIPAFISVMGMYVTFIHLGLTDSLTGVIVAHLIPTLPYMVRALIVSYSTLGFQWEEQGRMLGAGPIRRFGYIVMPHLLPGVVAGASLSILISLSQYIVTLLVGGGQVMTLPLLLFPFISGGDPAIGSAYTVMFAGMAAFALFIMDFLLKRYYGKKITVHM